MTDYLNRGNELEYMCIYEYCSEIEKKKFSDNEKEKYLKDMKRQTREKKIILTE